MKKQIRVRELGGRNFRSLRVFRVEFPQAGMVHVKGPSGVGKSSLVMALAWLFGGCPYPGTELQAWGSEDPTQVYALLETPEGEVRVERSTKGGLKVGKVRGKDAEVELTRLFGGMDAPLRAAASYRAQDGENAFLDLTDERKKHMLAQSLGIRAYEKVGKEAAEAAAAQQREVDRLKGAWEVAAAAAAAAEKEREFLASVHDDENLKEAQKAVAEYEAKVAGAEQNLAKQEAVFSAMTASSAQKARAARADAEAAVPTPTWSPGVAEGLEADLAKARERLAKVEARDAQARVEVERKRGELRVRVAAGRAAATQVPKLRSDKGDVQSDLAKARDGCCYTCGQSWVSDDAVLDLERKIAEYESRIREAGLIYLDGEVAANELKTVLDPEPHHFGPQLRQAIQDLTVQLAAVREERTRAASAYDSAVRRAGDEAARAAEASSQEALAQLRQKLENWRANLAGDRRLLAEAVERLHVARAGLARVEAAVAAQAKAAAALSASTETYSEAAAKLAMEQDVTAACGRGGYQGVIFDDVLAEIASEACSALGEVENTRHLVFGWDADETRIAPTVTIDQVTRPMRSALSGGMASVVKLAVDLSVGAVCARRHGTYPGWLVLDESFNGLGPLDKEAALELVRRYASDRLILVIDHNSNFTGVFDRVMEVKKSVDGWSEIC